MDDKVAASAERSSTEFTDVVPGIAVEFHMLLQVLFKVEGLPTSWLRAAERLLVDMLVLLVVIQILPVGEDPSTAREVAGHQLSFGSFPLQRLSHVQLCRHLRGPAEFQPHLSI